MEDTNVVRTFTKSDWVSTDSFEEISRAIQSLKRVKIKREEKVSVKHQRPKLKSP